MMKRRADKIMLRILCIDKDDALVAFLGDLLRKSGYATVGASSLEAGFKILSSCAVDAVMVGADLPEVNLKRVCRNVRSRRPRAAILVYGTLDRASEDILETVDGIVRKGDIAGLLVLLRAVEAEQQRAN